MTSVKKERLKHYTCTCCGVWFDDFPSVQDKFDVDNHYGKCLECAKEAEEKNEKEWQDLEKKVSDSFGKEENRKKFLEMEMELRRGIIIKMIEDGIIQFSIGGSRVAQ